jgi:hypothetical protein
MLFLGFGRVCETRTEDEDINLKDALYIHDGKDSVAIAALVSVEPPCVYLRMALLFAATQP